MEHVVGLILSYPDSMLERFIFPINIFLNCHYKTIKWLALSPIVVVQMISNIISPHRRLLLLRLLFPVVPKYLKYPS